MTSSEEPTFGLALTIMEVQRLARNGILRIGDRIRSLDGAGNIPEVIDLAPDLGEAREDYLLAKLVPGVFSGQAFVRPDRPSLRVLSRGDIASFHLMRHDAQDLLEDRARDLGIDLADAEWEDAFDKWQKETRARGLQAHAGRLLRECRLPHADDGRIASVERAITTEVEVKQSIGTPAYGWAVVFKSALEDQALKDDPALKERIKSALADLRARPFSGAEFFAVEGSEAAALAKDLRPGSDADPSVPPEALAWLYQIAHQHFRGEPPTPEAFSGSVTWLAHVIGAEWTACCLEVFCKGAVRLDARPSLAWPTVADLACYTGSAFTPAGPDAGPEPQPSASPPVAAPDEQNDKQTDEQTDSDPNPSDPADDTPSLNEEDTPQEAVPSPEETPEGAAEAAPPSAVPETPAESKTNPD